VPVVFLLKNNRFISVVGEVVPPFARSIQRRVLRGAPRTGNGPDTSRQKVPKDRCHQGMKGERGETKKPGRGIVQKKNSGCNGGVETTAKSTEISTQADERGVKLLGGGTWDT